MAGVRREQDLVAGLAGDDDFAVGQAARRLLGVDHDLELAPLPYLGGEPFQFLVAEAEAPRGGVVGGPVRDQAGLVGERVEVVAQGPQRHPIPRRDAVLDEVQRALGPVDHPRAVGRSDVGVADAPLLGDRPVEHAGAGRDFRDPERDALADGQQRLPQAVAGDAAPEGQQLSHERVQRLAEVGVVRLD